MWFTPDTQTLIIENKNPNDGDKQLTGDKRDWENQFIHKNTEYEFLTNIMWMLFDWLEYIFDRTCEVAVTSS